MYVTIQCEDEVARDIFHAHRSLITNICDQSGAFEPIGPKEMVAKRSQANKAVESLAKYCMESNRVGDNVMRKIDAYNHSKKVVFENDQQMTGDILEKRFEDVRKSLEERLKLMHNEYNMIKIEVREIHELVGRLNLELRAVVLEKKGDIATALDCVEGVEKFIAQMPRQKLAQNIRKS